MVVESHIFQIARHEDLAAVVEQVTSGANATKKINQAELPQGLQSFLGIVFHNPSSGAVAFIDRREHNVPPILDVYVLWSRPIDLFSDSRMMQEMYSQHAEIFEPFHPIFNSYLHIVDPRRYPSAEVLSRDLAVRAESAASARVIACASFIRV